MNGTCNCHGLNSGDPEEKPYHIPGRKQCECDWDLRRISTIITDIDWETNADGLVYELSYTQDDLMQCTNPKCGLIKVC